MTILRLNYLTKKIRSTDFLNYFFQVIPLDNDFAAKFDGETAKLIIRHVYPEDEGEYTCIATNELGKAYTSACLVVDGEFNNLHMSVVSVEKISLLKVLMGCSFSTTAEVLSIHARDEYFSYTTGYYVQV